MAPAPARMQFIRQATGYRVRHGVKDERNSENDTRPGCRNMQHLVVVEQQEGVEPHVLDRLADATNTVGQHRVQLQLPGFQACSPHTTLVSNHGIQADAIFSSYDFRNECGTSHRRGDRADLNL